MTWTYDTAINPVYGIFAVKVRRGQQTADVSFVRGAPTIIDNLTYADPFGDATAVLRFPSVTGFDDLGGTEVWWLHEFTNVDVYYLPVTSTSWHAGEELAFNPISNKRDLYVHQLKQNGDPLTPIWEGFMVSVEPSVDGVMVQCQGCLYQLDYYYAKPLMPSRPRTVEDILRRYMNKAYRGLNFEPMIIDWPDDWTKYFTQGDYNAFQKMGERYIPLSDLLGMIPADAPSGTLPLGSPWTGYVTRNYGSWEKILTGYIQGQLSYMYTVPEGGSSLVKGDQWTITKRGSRQPHMYVRRKSKAPTCEVWYGQPGVDCRLTRDGAQVVNVFFGEGRGANQAGDTQWNLWRQPNPMAQWSIYQPLASLRADQTPVHQSLRADHNYPEGYGLYHFFDKAAGYPTHDPAVSGDTWPVKDSTSDRDIVRLPDAYDAAYELWYGMWVSEKKVTFPDGIDEGTARDIAYNWLEQDKDPGWQGTIDLKVDLRSPGGAVVSKWDLRDGDVIVLKGFQGYDTETPGTNKFHISQVTMNPMDGTVSLTVDTKFRDLLTVEESIARGRDSLAPIKSLQVNRRSAMLNDMIVPWNIRQGSGYFPRQAVALPIYKDAFPHSFSDGKGTLQQNGNRPRDIFTPAYKTGSGMLIGCGFDGTLGTYAANDQSLENPLPPGVVNYGQVLVAGKEALYVPVKSGDADPLNRWAFFPMLLSQAGTIGRSEFAIYDLDGNIVPVEFHVSIYPVPHITRDYMPWNGEQGALVEGAFQEYRPDGFKYNQVDDEQTMADAPPIIGWGSGEQPAGYSPKQKIVTSTAPPTGLLIDGAPWSYNFLGEGHFPNIDPGPGEMRKLGAQIVSAGVAVYIDHTPNKAWTYIRGRCYRMVEGA